MNDAADRTPSGASARIRAGRPGPDRAAIDTEAARLLAELARRIASSLELTQTLQLVVQAAVDQLGFGCALVNLVRPGDVCEVVAIAGPEEAISALLGTRASVQSWHRLLASCEDWGDLRFLDHRSDQSYATPIPGWVPPIEPSDLPEAWHPEDMLLAPLLAPDGALIGVLSIDMPVDGRRPDAQRRQLLGQFAVHAALAIENSRVHTLVADSEQLFRAMFDRSPIAIALLTEDQRITRVNTACEQLLGHAAADLLGRRAPELSRPDSAPGRRSTDTTISTHDQYEIHFTRPDGNEVWGRVNSTLLATETGDGPDGHAPSLVLTQIEDITMLRTIQASFAHAATHDRLTGLANRTLVLDRLAAALTESHQGDGRVAVLYCDLDHFKEINDTLGHAAGDHLLVEVGRRLERAARQQDTVGRLGGDEFVMISRQLRTPAEAGRLAARVMQVVQQPVELCGQPGLPSLSVGVALATPGDSSDSVLAAADRAMYAAKAAGRGRWHLAPDAGPVTPAFGVTRALPAERTRPPAPKTCVRFESRGRGRATDDGGTMNDELNPQDPQASQTPQDNPEKDPEDWVTGDEPMTGPQQSYLQTLAREAGREVDLDALSKAGASKLIDELQVASGRGTGHSS